MKKTHILCFDINLSTQQYLQTPSPRKSQSRASGTKCPSGQSHHANSPSTNLNLSSQFETDCSLKFLYLLSLTLLSEVAYKRMTFPTLLFHLARDSPSPTLPSNYLCPQPRVHDILSVSHSTANLHRSRLSTKEIAPPKYSPHPYSTLSTASTSTSTLFIMLS